MTGRLVNGDDREESGLSAAQSVTRPSTEVICSLGFYSTRGLVYNHDHGIAWFIGMCEWNWSRTEQDSRSVAVLSSRVVQYSPDIRLSGIEIMLLAAYDICLNFFGELTEFVELIATLIQG